MNESVKTGAIVHVKDEDFQISTVPEFLKPDVIKQQINLVIEVVKSVMKEGKHYGLIPGTDKKTPYKAGIDILNKAFHLVPFFEVTKTDLGNEHREIEVFTTLKNMHTGVIVGQGVGSCSTMEPKYRYRHKALSCPKCGKETVFKSKIEDKPGWFCWRKKEGCGAIFGPEDATIKDQKPGKNENTDPAEQWNTILKMAKKRSNADATVSATLASDIFLNDINEGGDPAGDGSPEPKAGAKKEKAPIRRKTSHPSQGKENFDFYLNIAKKQDGKLQEKVQGIIDDYSIDSQNPQKDWNDNDHADVAAAIKTLLKNNGVNV